MVEFKQLLQWVALELEKQPDIHLSGDLALSPLPGDAGARQYFQVNTQPPLLAVMAPAAVQHVESAEYFAEMASVLRRYAVPAPLVLAFNSESNFLLIERFQGEDLINQLSASTVDTLYGSALFVLLALQQIPASAIQTQEYSRELLLAEMDLFRQWFVESLLEYPLSDNEHCIIDNAFNFLISQALSQPQVLVHRDYHCRNLIYREGDIPGVIDFQDAVRGPITYDLVSLLRDCYVRWSPAQVKQWALAYANMAYEVGLLPVVSTDTFLRWFDTMGLQRHIKVLGIFARLSLRDSKDRYLNDLPLVIRYVLEVAREYPEMQEFVHWFEAKLLPLLPTQSWYSDYRVAGDTL